MKKKELLWLFGVNVFISSFTFGGGYVVVPMIRQYFVEKKNYFTEEELMGMAAIAQSSPGAIAINLAVLAGYRVAKFKGAFLSCVASILPSLIILSIISAFYTMFISNPVVSSVLKGMQAGVAALIVVLVIDMCQMIIKEKSLFLTALIPLSFVGNFIFNLNVALILSVSCLLCIGKVYLEKRK